MQDIQTSGSATFGCFTGPHPISGVSSSNMARLIAINSGYGNVTATLLRFTEGVSEHINSAGVVTYTGPLPPPPPPVFTENGTISGLVAATMAALISQKTGFSFVCDRLLRECEAIVDHIQNNALVTSGVIA